MIFMKRFSRQLLCAAVATAACSIFAAGQAYAADDVVIGVLVPTTGAVSPLGLDMQKGYELAVKDVPTVKGHPVRLVVEDTQANPATGLTKAQKLVLQDHAKVLVGAASSAVALAVAAQAERLNVPIVSTNAQAVQVTGEQCNRYVFRTNPNDAMVGKATSVLMQQRPDLLKKKWFVVFHDFVWGRSNKAEFAKIPGVKIVGEAGRPMGTADWSSAISQIQSSGADAIYLALAVGDDMPSFIRQARSFGLKQFMLPPLGMPDSMLAALGADAPSLVTGGLFGSWMTEDSNKEMARFVKSYVAQYHVVPGPQAIQAYAGMRLTLAALNAAPSLSSQDIIKTMENTSIDTVIGKLAIRKQDHQGMVGTFLSESVALDKSPYGAKVGWKVIEPLPWDRVKIDPAQTGCKAAL